MNTTAAIDLFV